MDQYNTFAYDHKIKLVLSPQIRGDYRREMYAFNSRIPFQVINA